LSRRSMRRWPRWRAAAPLLAPLALCLPGPQVALAQAPTEILPPKPMQRPQAARPVLPDFLKPTLDGQEPRDLTESQLRPAPRDGDVTPPAEPPLRDGIIDLDTSDQQVGPEGIDTANIDARPPSDTGAFESPPAGHDPQLFQTEDILPLADRRLETFFRNEPFQPVGYRLGSFVLFPEIELAGVGYSNVLRSPKARADLALEAKPELRLVSNWRWHALELKANGNLSFHDEFPSEDNKNALLEARGRLDFTRKSNIQGLASQQVTQESRSGVDAARASQRADVTTNLVAASLNHRFNRLNVQLRGGVTDIHYGTLQDETTGATLDSRDRNLVQTEQAVRVRYDLKSSVGVFAETALVQRDYEAAPPDGLKRDSEGERYRFGLAFFPEHRWLRGEASLGWGRQQPNNQGLSTVDALLVDANVVLRATPLTSVLFTARSDIGDSINDNTSGVVTRALGVEGRQILRKYLTATAGVQVSRNRYVGISLDEKETSARLGLEYSISREIQLFSRYEHIWLDTTQLAGDWQADEFRLGMRLRH